MKKRKIAMLAASWDGEAMEATIHGIKARLEGTGMDLHVFMCFPAFGLDSPENFAHYNIFSLPNLKEYEGIIFSVNVVHGYEMIKRYFPELLSIDVPKVSLELEMEGIPSVISSSYGAEYQLVEHLITEHGCRKINYVGGAPEHPDNIVRKKAYIDALTAHGIAIEEERIRDYAFVDVNGREAYADFKESGMEIDAVVCANDAMALGYCQAAEEDGKYPPEDFLIVGYDNDENSKGFTPMITSVDKDAYGMGREACDVLLRIVAGEKAGLLHTHEQKPILRGSCGCYSAEERVELTTKQLQRQIYYRVKEENEYFDRLNGVRQNLALSDNEGLFGYYLNETLTKYDIYGYCMCINQSVYYGTHQPEFTWEAGYDEELYVLGGGRQGVREEESRIIRREDLVPDYLMQEDETVHDYIFVPMQKQGPCLGYLVFVDATCVLPRRMLLYICATVNNAYYNLRNLENLRKMNKRLDNVYVKDALTDMYNRFGYMRDGYAMFEKSRVYGKPLMVMFMDMDRLKDINDVFGHSQGDNALILFSNVLKKCVADEKIAVRYGGDEFLIIGSVEDREEAEAFKQKLEAELAATNASSGLPYPIEASIGYVLTDPKGKDELDDYVKQADELMYEVKKKNRKNRKSFFES